MRAEPPICMSHLVSGTQACSRLVQSCQGRELRQRLYLNGAQGLPYDRKPSELDGSTTRVCPGKAGLVVLISEDDLRETVLPRPPRGGQGAGCRDLVRPVQLDHQHNGMA